MGSLAANISQKIFRSINLSSFFSLRGNIRFPHFLAIAAILLFLENHPASAATVIWNGLGSDGACGTGNGNNWSCGQNWAGSVAPSNADIAQFDSTSIKDAVIDTTYTGFVAGVDIKSSYTGTITQSRTFIVGSSGYIQAGGVFNGGGFGMDVNSGFTLSGGTFNAPSASLFIAGNFTHTSGGTFNHNSGTVVFDFLTTPTVTADINTSETFNNLTINKASGSTLTLTSGDTFIVLGTLTLTDGNIDSGSIDAPGNIAHGTNFDGGSATISITGTASRTVNLAGGGQLPSVVLNAANVTVNGPSSGTASVDNNFSIQNGFFSGGTGNFTASGPFSQSGGSVSLGNGLFTTNGSFTLSNGTFTADAGNLAFNAGLTLTGGTFNMGGGTLTVTNAAFSQSAGTFNGGTTGTADFNNPFNLSGGVFNAPKTSFFSSHFSQTGGTFNHNNGKAVFDAFFSMGIDVSTTTTFNDLEFALTGTSTAGIAEADVIIALGQLSLKDGLVSSQSVTSTLGAQGNVTVSPTFDGGTTPLFFAGGNSQVFDLTGAADKFDADVSINKLSGSTMTLASDLLIDSIVGDQDLSILSGTLDLASHNLTVGDDFTINGTCITGSSNTVTVTDSLAVATSVGNFNGQGATINAGRVTIAGGTFTSTSGTLTVLGNWTHTSATAVFNHNNGTVAFSGTGQTVADVNSNENFYNLTINKTSVSGGTTDDISIASADTLTVQGNLQMTAGQSQSGTLGPEGNVTVGSGFNGGGSALIFKGSNVQNFDLTGAVGKFDSDITINKTGGEVDLLSDLTMDAANQDLLITAGTFDINGHNLTVNGSSGTFILQSGGNFQLQGNETTTSPQQQNGSNITYDGAGDYAALVTGNTYTSSLNFKGSGKWKHTGLLTVNANLKIVSGTFDSNGQSINISGDWDNTGSYTSGNNTVTFTGTDQTVKGATIFNHLTKIASVASTLTFPAGVTNTILGTMTLQGSSSSSRLSLRSSVNGTRAQIDPQGSRVVQHLDVKDDKNVNATAIPCLTGCVSSGNNHNWLFGNQTIQFTASSSSGTEGVTSVNLAVNLSSSLADDATVNYAVTGGSAGGGGVDYTLANGTATITAGNTTTNIAITIVDDALNELDETIQVTLSNPINVTLGSTVVHTYTINNDDAVPSVTLSLTGSPMAENAGQAEVKATLSAVSGQNVTVDLTFTGTATLTDDYTRTGTQIVINAGQTEGTVTLTAVSDSINEPAETVIADISNVTNGTESGTQQVTATITDDDTAPSVTLSLTGSPMAENGGQAEVKATLSAVSGQNVTVDLTFTGTATLTDDYTRTGTQIVINAGQTEGTVTLTAVSDSINEPAETVIADIGNVTNGTESGTQQVTATITDDDTAPSVTLSLTGSPMAENAGQAEVKATLSAVSGQNVTVDLTFTGTATLTDDYTRTGTQIVINAGQTEGTVTLTAVSDSINEPAETVIADISNVTNGTESGTQQVTATITDDDTAPSVFYSQMSQTQNESFGVITVQVELSAPSGFEVTVPFTVGGSARNPEDYSITSSPLTIPAGEISANISLQIVEDSISEPDETIQITMGNPTNASQGSTTEHTVTLEDNDALPDVKFELSESSGSENADSVMIQVILSEASEQTVTVNYLASGGTASGNGEDYILDSGSLTFDPSDTVKSIELTIVNDDEDETDETVEISLLNPENAVLIEPDLFTYTIEDDDEEEGEGTITMTADNCYVLYVNGVEIGADCDWQSVENYTVDIQEGDIIAIRADDTGGIGGLAFQIQKGGKLQVSDFTWHVFASNVPPEGWEQSGFDASHWMGATEHFKMGEGPWGILPGFDSSVKWIWSKSRVFDNRVFFITQFHPDQNALVKVSADNIFEAFVNGEEIGQGSAWPTVKFMPAHIEEGDLIAIHGADSGGLGGILSETLWRDENGNLRKIVSDGTWKSSANYNNGWLDQDFDDSSWLFATTYGRRGVNPWGNNGSLLEITSQAFWIWSAHAGSDNDVWVRKQVPNGSIQITADNKYELYINGRLIGVGISWLDVQNYSVYLEEGDIVAVKAENLGGPAGVISSIALNGDVLLTNSSWKIKNLEETGWNEKDFDDSAWDQARSFGSNDIWPWGRRPGIDPMAMWIWTHVPETDNIIFLRYEIGQSNAAQGLTKIECTADDEYSLYHNGYKVLEGNSWRISKKFYAEISSGDVLAVQAKDKGYKAGLLLNVSGAFDFVSDETWKWTVVEETGWQGLNFNDFSWLNTHSYGSYGAQPWGAQVMGFEGDSTAQWIWSNRNETGGDNRDTNVFFRKNID